MPRKTDSGNPADWLYFAERYPGFDLEDPDWPSVTRTVNEVSALLEEVRRRIGQGDRAG